MEVNPVRLLLHPMQSVKNSISKPDFNIAFFIVLLPTVLLLLTFIVSGLSFDAVALAVSGFKFYLTWLLMSASIYFFTFVAKGKTMKGKFSAIYSSISVAWLFVAIAILLIFLVSFIFSPSFFSFVKVAQNEELNTSQISQLLTIMTSGSEQSMFEFKEANNIQADLMPLLLGEGEQMYNTEAMVIALFVCAILFFYALFVYPFLTIKAVSGLNAATSFVLYLFSMSILYLFSLGMTVF